MSYVATFLVSNALPSGCALDAKTLSRLAGGVVSNALARSTARP